MVTREEVIGAYRYLLGREPESEAVIRAQQDNPSFAVLRSAFLASPEFQAQLLRTGMVPNPLGRHRSSPPMQVELTASPEDLSAMFNYVASSWDTLGQRDPYWSVLAFERFGSTDEFYATGQREVAMISAFFARAEQELTRIQSCLDFGCGLGRVTFALAPTIPVVYGLDVSASHLTAAQEQMESLGLTNVRLSRLTRLEDLSNSPQIDFLFSFLVLQHNPPPLMAQILEKLFQRVSSGGFALFQVPTYRSGYRFVWDEYRQGDRALMEMHALPQSSIFGMLEKHNFEIIEVHEDAEAHDPDFVSQTFFARRAGRYESML